MNVNPSRPLVIYHGNCADGFGAAWCFWRKYGDQADYVAGVYQQPPPDVTGRDVYLVDFSYKHDVVERMLDIAAHVTLIDHHKTAIEDLALIKSDKFTRYTDLNRSGAMLAWDFLFVAEQPPQLLLHIQDRDLWRFLLSDTREISAALFSYEYSFEVWDTLMNLDPAGLYGMVLAGAAIERKLQKDVRELLAVCQRTMVIGGVEVPVASLPYTMVSEAAHQMAQGVPFAACYWDTKDGRVFGLRSAPELGIDVSDIAKLYGGGGHAHAAGFTVPRDHPLAVG